MVYRLLFSSLSALLSLTGVSANAGINLKPLGNVDCESFLSQAEVALPKRVPVLSIEGKLVRYFNNSTGAIVLHKAKIDSRWNVYIATVGAELPSEIPMKKIRLSVMDQEVYDQIFSAKNRSRDVHYVGWLTRSGVPFTPPNLIRKWKQLSSVLRLRWGSVVMSADGFDVVTWDTGSVNHIFETQHFDEKPEIGMIGQPRTASFAKEGHVEVGYVSLDRGGRVVSAELLEPLPELTYIDKEPTLPAVFYLSNFDKLP